MVAGLSLGQISSKSHWSPPPHLPLSFTRATGHAAVIMLSSSMPALHRRSAFPPPQNSINRSCCHHFDAIHEVRLLEMSTRC